MKQYLNLLNEIMLHGIDKGDRTGTGTASIFGTRMRFNLRQGFPATTTKKLAWKSMVGELLWMIEGSRSDKRLAEITFGDPDHATIWTANANADYWKPKAEFEGDLGRVYGVQWRQWQYPLRDPPNPHAMFPNLRAIRGMHHIDQLYWMIEGLKKDPNGRRHILTAWNPGELDQMALPPCHLMAQFDVTNGYLSCQMYQRSVDSFLGLPFNIASYSLLTHMLAQVCGYKAGDFVWVGGDTHVYKNHFEQVKEQLSREPYPLPTLWINPDVKEITGFKMEDFRLENYQHHSSIKAEMAV